MPSNKCPWMTLLSAAEHIHSPTAGQKLISMLMVLTNVLWSWCRFLTGFELWPAHELNCKSHYHNCIFSQDLYAQQGRRAPVSWTWHFCHRSDSKHRGKFPERSYFSAVSVYFLPVLLISIHLLFVFFSPCWRYIHFLLCPLPSSIMCLCCIGHDDSELSSGYGCTVWLSFYIAPSDTHTHTSHLSVIVFFISHHLALTHCVSVFVNMPLRVLSPRLSIVFIWTGARAAVMCRCNLIYLHLLILHHRHQQQTLLYKSAALVRHQK